MAAMSGTLEPLTTRAKIGLVVVSASSVSELRYPRVVPEVGFLASRMMLGGDQGLEALLEMEQSSSGRCRNWRRRESTPSPIAAP